MRKSIIVHIMAFLIMMTSPVLALLPVHEFTFDDISALSDDGTTGVALSSTATSCPTEFSSTWKVYEVLIPTNGILTEIDVSQISVSITEASSESYTAEVFLAITIQTDNNPEEQVWSDCIPISVSGSGTYSNSVSDIVVRVNATATSSIYIRYYVLINGGYGYDAEADSNSFSIGTQTYKFGAVDIRSYSLWLIPIGVNPQTDVVASPNGYAVKIPSSIVGARLDIYPSDFGDVGTVIAWVKDTGILLSNGTDSIEITATDVVFDGNSVSHGLDMTQWQKIAIAWNTTTIRVYIDAAGEIRNITDFTANNWVPKYIGGAPNATSGITIDHMKVYDAMLSAEEIALELAIVKQYVLDITFANNQTARVIFSPEDYSNFVDDLYVSVLDPMTGTTYTTITMSLNSSTTTFETTVPTNNTVMVSVSTQDMGRVVSVPPSSQINIAVPSGGTYFIGTITVYRRVDYWKWLKITTTDGKYIFFGRWDQSPISVLFKAGAPYVFSVLDENMTEEQIVLISSVGDTTVLTLPNPLAPTIRTTDLIISAFIRPEDNKFQIFYYDPYGLTEEVSIYLYDSNGAQIAALTYNVNYLNFVSDVIPYSYKVVFTRNGTTQTWEDVVGYIENQEGSILPIKMFPKTLIAAFLFLVVAFAFPSAVAHWAPIALLGVALLLKASGWGEFNPVLLPIFGAMAFYSLTTRGEGQ